METTEPLASAPLFYDLRRFFLSRFRKYRIFSRIKSEKELGSMQKRACTREKCKRAGTLKVLHAAAAEIKCALDDVVKNAVVKLINEFSLL